MLVEILEDLRNMVVMFSQVLGVHKDVVDVDNYKQVEELPEHLIHVSLEYGGGADQSKQYHMLFVVSCRGHKSCFPFVPLKYPNEAVCTPEVQLGKDCCVA